MKLLLIAPASRIKALKSKLKITQMALGIIASLTPDDIEVEILHEPDDKINYDDNVDLVGLSVATNTATRAYEIADNFQKRGVKVVMGGIHPTILPDEALQHCDSVVCVQIEAISSGFVQQPVPFGAGITFKARIKVNTTTNPIIPLFF